MTDAMVVLVTAPDVETAVEIARTLVEEKLAACGNLVPRIRSIYRWEGKTQDDEEVLLILKAPRQNFERLRARVVSLHPYQVPEVIALNIEEGHQPYLEWVTGEKG